MAVCQFKQSKMLLRSLTVLCENIFRKFYLIFLLFLRFMLLWTLVTILEMTLQLKFLLITLKWSNFLFPNRSLAFPIHKKHPIYIIFFLMNLNLLTFFMILFLILHFTLFSSNRTRIDKLVSLISLLIFFTIFCVPRRTSTTCLKTNHWVTILRQDLLAQRKLNDLIK